MILAAPLNMKDIFIMFALAPNHGIFSWKYFPCPALESALPLAWLHALKISDIFHNQLVYNSVPCTSIFT